MYTFFLNRHLHIRRGSGTSDNLHQLACDDGLASAVEENLVLADHLASVLGGVLFDMVRPIINKG